MMKIVLLKLNLFSVIYILYILTYCKHSLQRLYFWAYLSPKMHSFNEQNCKDQSTMHQIECKL